MAAPFQVHLPLFQALAPFDPAETTVTGWMQRFEQFCAANMVPNEPVFPVGHIVPHNRKRDLFLCFVGPRAYEVLRCACLPALPSVATIPQLQEMLMARFEPPGLVPAQRHLFMSRNQRDNETIQEYIAALQHLASRCDFGAYYAQALRDRLISGVRSDDSRKRCLRIVDPTFENVKDLPMQEEAVAQQAKAIAQAMSQSVHVVHQKNHKKKTVHSKPQQHVVKKNPSAPRSAECWRCGRNKSETHTPDTCSAKRFKCNTCKEKGHYAKKCPTGVTQRVNAVQEPDQVFQESVRRLLNCELLEPGEVSAQQ